MANQLVFHAKFNGRSGALLRSARDVTSRADVPEIWDSEAATTVGTRAVASRLSFERTDAENERKDAEPDESLTQQKDRNG
ncbi:hypothetical protein [Burkholderia vietnamiensis]|uniref:hypothetical protein n=1 Tax=Burkholderia vietnamiensis TaxID=60552 RepID=UPI001128B349|nr:hypothetical protein [Burkholderia vietnamiensis]